MQRITVEAHILHVEFCLKVFTYILHDLYDLKHQIYHKSLFL